MASMPVNRVLESRVPVTCVRPLVTGAGLLAAAAYIAAFDPARGGAFLPCPLHAATGLWCPGCGLTRATHELLHGDLVDAFRLNAFVLVVLAAIVFGWAAWLLDSLGRRVLRPLPASVYAAAIVAFAAFGVVRNLPGVHGLRG